MKEKPKLNWSMPKTITQLNCKSTYGPANSLLSTDRTEVRRRSMLSYHIIRIIRIICYHSWITQLKLATCTLFWCWCWCWRRWTRTLLMSSSTPSSPSFSGKPLAKHCKHPKICKRIEIIMIIKATKLIYNTLLRQIFYYICEKAIGISDYWYWLLIIAL